MRDLETLVKEKRDLRAELEGARLEHEALAINFKESEERAGTEISQLIDQLNSQLELIGEYDKLKAKH